MRGLFGACALACYYWTVTRMPLAEATTIHHTAPVVTAVLAWRLLGERIGGSGWLALGLGMVGVVVVARPTAVFGGVGLDPVPVVVALAGAICSASAYVTVRKLAQTEMPLVIVFYFPLVALPLAIPWAAPVLVMPRGEEWLLLAGVGVTTQIAQVFLTMALARERAGRATAVGYLQVALAMGWGALIFAEIPPPLAFVGAAMIVGATILVGATRTQDAQGT
jgi:drug/metabolite transporter (DMT)-like permease